MTRGLALLLEAPGDRLALAGPDVVLVERTGQPPVRLGILALDSVLLGAAAQAQAGALARLTAAGVPVTLLSATRDATQTLAHHGASGLAEYFSPSWTAFQADRGRCFSVMVDGVSV